MMIATKGSIQLRADQYVFPPRAQEAIPISDAQIFADMDWTAQLKYNDGRCLIKYKNGEVELWNRHAERFRTYRAPDELIDQLIEIRDRLGLSTTQTSLLDGGVLDQKHHAIKNTIVIWDVLAINGEHLLGSAYRTRYAHLHDRISTQESWNFTNATGTYDLGIKITNDVLMPRNINAKDWQDTWDTITKINAPYTTGKPGDRNYDCKPVIEGLMFKNPDGKLEMGYKEKNNSNWLCRSRVMTGRHRC